MASAISKGSERFLTEIKDRYRYRGTVEIQGNLVFQFCYMLHKYFTCIMRAVEAHVDTLLTTPQIQDAPISTVPNVPHPIVPHSLCCSPPPLGSWPSMASRASFQHSLPNCSISSHGGMHADKHCTRHNP